MKKDNLILKSNFIFGILLAVCLLIQVASIIISFKNNAFTFFSVLHLAFTVCAIIYLFCHCRSTGFKVLLYLTIGLGCIIGTSGVVSFFSMATYLGSLKDIQYVTYYRCSSISSALYGIAFISFSVFFVIFKQKMKSIYFYAAIGLSIVAFVIEVIAWNSFSGFPGGLLTTMVTTSYKMALFIGALFFQSEKEVSSPSTSKTFREMI